MEAVIFCGIQASGKSSFFKEHFFATHVRISMDLLRTRNREQRLLDFCLETRQPFAVDNTNPARADRARYLDAARSAGFRVTGYYFQSRLQEALERNRSRTGKEQIPEAGVRGTYATLELPTLTEGFDTLFYVSLAQGIFTITPWNDEI